VRAWPATGESATDLGGRIVSIRRTIAAVIASSHVRVVQIGLFPRWLHLLSVAWPEIAISTGRGQAGSDRRFMIAV
jgi:hypothetical protein